jgi:hypothetical protein
MRASSVAYFTFLPLMFLVGIATAYGLSGWDSIPGKERIL